MLTEQHTTIGSLLDNIARYRARRDIVVNPGTGESPGGGA